VRGERPTATTPLLCKGLQHTSASRAPIVGKERLLLRMRGAQLVGWRGWSETALILLTAAGASLTTSTRVLHRTLLSNPLPVSHAEGVVVFAYRLSAEEYGELATRARTLDSVAVYKPQAVRLSKGGAVGKADGALVTPNYFKVLRVHPILGRGFSATDSGSGAPVAMVSEALWHRYFGDRRELGDDWLQVEDRSYRIVGVLPSTFRGTTLDQTPEVFVPLYEGTLPGTFLPGPLLERIPRGGWLVGIGRLKSGASVSEAAAEALRLLSSMRDSRWTSSDRTKALLESLATAAIPAEVRAPIRQMIAVLSALTIVMVGAVAANIANLIGLRVLRQRAEIGVRQVIGATPGRIAREFAVKYGALGLVGSLLGLAPASAYLSIVHRMRLAQFVTLSPDFRLEAADVLAAAVLGVAMTAIISGLFAWAVSAGDISERTRQGAGSSQRTRQIPRIAVVLQVALSITLLAPTLQVVRAFEQLRSAPLGFNSRNVLWARLDLRLAGLKREAYAGHLARIRGRLRQLAGVDDVASSTTVPLGWVRFVWPIRDPRNPDAGQSDVAVSFVDRHYFSTLGLRFIAGSGFSSDEATDEVVVDRAAALRYWNGRPEAVGGTLHDVADDRELRVVGVVENSRYYEFNEQPAPHLYLPVCRNLGSGPWAVVTVRSAGNPTNLVSTVRRAIGEVAPTVPVSELMTMEQHIGLYLARPRLLAWCAALFAFNSIALAMLGVYFIVRYVMETQRREIAIRVAVGASPADIYRWMGTGVLRWGAAALGLGVLGAAASMALLRKEGYGASSGAVSTLLATATIVTLAVLPAILVPVARMSHGNPSETLRRE
jgi:predicted permease